MKDRSAYNGQAIAETVFEIPYLSFVIIAGLIMIVKGKSPLVKLAGVMSLVLGLGDSFHLIPRVYALWTGGTAEHVAILGIGKLITSITMTLFYMITYYVWRGYYEVEGRKPVTYSMWALAILRIALSLLPQNEWLSPNPSLLFGVLRNIPFTAMGILMIILFYQETRRTGKQAFRHMPLAITLSYGFYLPVVLLAGIYPIVGTLMIPKTMAYVWAVLMVWKVYKEEQKQALPET
jgi:hypothetical protein